MNDLKARYRGCLLGLAVGDAVGTTVEFSPPGSFAPVADMVGGGPFRLQAGEWTDDTSMALCLAESLLERDGFDAADQMDRYLRWYRHGHLSSNGRCFDIGNTVSSALRRYEQTGDPWAGSTDAYSAGNGSIMRLATVPLFFAADATRAVAMSGESSRTTHGAPACVDACRYLGGLIVGALRGEPKDTLLSPRYCPAGAEPWAGLDPDIAAIADGSFARRSPPDIVGSGYVVRSLEAALWAFHRADSFEEGCLLAVNLGDDADTTAAVYGQLAGAFYGEAGIPARWCARLAQGALITGFADRLYEAAQ
ncbi:MAG TPA: ADP-ribosylglycohydrolase family protein [Promineifilum sp.]|nr:ADP-ribosylglycohydrolase family protein [Promineifilum sp.]